MPDTYHPIAPLSGGAFTWRRVKQPPRRIELRSGPHLVATLTRTNLTGSRLLGATAEGAWLLVRGKPRSFRLESGSWTAFDPATFDTAEPYCAARLQGDQVELPGAPDLRWGRTSLFSREHRFTTQGGAVVLSFLGRRDLTFDAAVAYERRRELAITVSRDFEHLPPLPVLTLLGWREIVASIELEESGPP